MAFTRRFLTALGIEADKVDEIISAHVEVVDGLKEERDNFKADAEKLESVQKELDAMKEAAKNGGENPFEKKYNDLKAENDTLKSDFEKYKEEILTKETKHAKEAAFRNLLKESGVAEKRFDSILKVTSLDEIELDEDGKIKDEDGKFAENVKNEWADFIVSKQVKGADVANPPANNGGNTLTKEEILSIKDGVERRKAMADNPELFGIATQ